VGTVEVLIIRCKNIMSLLYLKGLGMLCVCDIYGCLTIYLYIWICMYICMVALCVKMSLIV
jgi:hypothetical protein